VGALTEGKMERMSVAFQLRSIMSATSGVAVCLESRPIMAASSGGTSFPIDVSIFANASPYPSEPHNSAVIAALRSRYSRSAPHG
jgi:hypothetical protein